MPGEKLSCIVRMDELCQKIQKMYVDDMRYVEISVITPDYPDEKPCISLLGFKKNDENAYYYNEINGIKLKFLESEF